MFRKISGGVRLAAAHARLPRLKAAADKYPREIVRSIKEWHGGYIRPWQDDEELAALGEEVKALQPATVLEIGTKRGGSLFLWAQLAQPDATIVSIDLPGGRFGAGYSRSRGTLYRRFVGPNQRVHLIRGDSHEESTKRQLESLLDGTLIDFIFVDGDHTYEGVRQDYALYAPLVRPQGLIAFHDIVSNEPEYGVPRFWEEVKVGQASHEYVVDGEKFGIGVLVRG